MEAVAADVGAAVAAEVVTSLLAKVKKHVGFLYKYEDNLHALQDARVHLDDKRKDSTKFAEYNRTKLREVGSAAARWNSDADDLLQKAENAISRDNISCLKIWSRYSSSKQAWELTQCINKKVSIAPSFGASFDLPIEEGATFNLRGCIDFESRATILDGVLEALQDDDVSMCSICGMGGIGKTTMAKKLATIIEAKRLVDKVAMVKVSHDPDFEKIQNEIIELLGLKFEESSMPGRARKLKYWLSNNTSLLIWDDVWRQMHDDDFEAVGIPLATNRCKMVFTSRNVHECEKMGSQRNFRVDGLDSEEARDLFVQCAEKSFEDSNLQETARKIVDECDGLPLAIVTVARALKDMPAGVWYDSLLKLQASEMEEVYSPIRLSYNLLNDQEAQSILRLCSLFPEDYDIPVDKLLLYGWGLELFRCVDSLKKARYRLDSIVQKLKNSFLLLEGEKDGFVQLHDIVRDFIISISSKDENLYLVRCGKEMEKWPEKSLYKKCSAISFVCDEIKDSIPTDFRCPNLELLQLDSKRKLWRLPIGINEGTEELKVVDWRVGPSLPPLTMQKKLKTLLIGRAYHFKFQELRQMVGEGVMENLEIFCVSSRMMAHDFPAEIGQLCNLRCLRLGKSSIIYIAPGVLSKLRNLEELELPCGFRDWGLKDGRENRVNASLDEIVNLPLTSVAIGLRDDLVLDEKLVQSITRFQIHIKGDLSSKKFGVHLNVLEFSHVNVCNVTKNWMSILVRTCDLLLLRRVKNLKYVMSQQLTGNNGLRMKTLDIKEMGWLEEIWHGPYLSNTQPPCFCNLTEIVIWSCPKLKCVFPLSVAAELKQLQCINISYCEEMEEVFYKDKVDDGSQVHSNSPTTAATTTMQYFSPNNNKPQLCLERGVNRVVKLHRLKRLCLERMSKLRILFDGSYEIECPLLEELTINGCNSMEGISYESFSAPGTIKLKLQGVRRVKNIFQWLRMKQDNGIPQSESSNLSKPFFPNLKGLFVREMDDLRKIWHGPYSPNVHAPCFSSLTEVSISHCPKLKRLFPLAVATELRQLQVMKIESCEGIEEIFYDDKVDDGNQVASSIQLNTQTVGTATKTTLLNSIETALSCPTPTSFIRSLLTKENQPKHLSSDQILEECNEKTDDGKIDDKIVLPRLKILRLDGMIKLRVLCNGDHAIECPSLEELAMDMEDFSYGPFRTPRIKKLELREVRSLKHTLEWMHVGQESGILHLVKLRIAKNYEMKYLIDPYLSNTYVSRLEELHIEKMYRLQEICHQLYLPDAHAPSYFRHLARMTIQNCPNLKHVFPISVAVELRQLLRLRISKCEEMEEIFHDDQLQIAPRLEKLNSSTTESSTPPKSSIPTHKMTVEENAANVDDAIVDTIVFPKLELLSLQELYKLRVLYDGSDSIEFPSLKSLTLNESYVEALSKGSFKAPKVDELIIDYTRHAVGSDLSRDLMKLVSECKRSSVFRHGQLGNRF